MMTRFKEYTSKISNLLKKFLGIRYGPKGYRTEYKWWYRFSGLSETCRQFRNDERWARENAQKHGIDPNKTLDEIGIEFLKKCKIRRSSQVTLDIYNTL